LIVSLREALKYILDINRQAVIEESITHYSFNNETDYLAKSKKNNKRLNKAVQNIKSGKCEVHGLIND